MVVMSANEGTVTCEVSDHIGTLTLSNPTKRNSLTVEMWKAIPRLLDELATDNDVRVVILRGHGDMFSAGSDISNLTYLHNSDLPGLAESALATFPKPVVAVIAGHCMGGGCQLATACDFRVAGEGADFAVPPGTVVVAAAAGRVLRVSSEFHRGGLKVFVDHGRGLLAHFPHSGGEDRARRIARPGAEFAEIRCGPTVCLLVQCGLGQRDDGIVIDRIHPSAGEDDGAGREVHGGDAILDLSLIHI